MRVTDEVIGGGAAPTVPRFPAQDIPPPPVAAQEASPPAQPAAAAAAAAPSPGLAAAVLRGCVGDFYRATAGLTNTLTTDVGPSLPQIVVVGQESSGKSSVLESLAMLPLFPRDSAICTRLPILLKMRHMSHGNVEGDPELMPHCNPAKPEQQIKMKLLYSDGRAPVESSSSFTPQEAAELMGQWMEQIVKDESDEPLLGVVDHVLEIQVSSPNVPNLNLIDLPGIVAGKLLDEPDDMMHRTRAIVEKYLEMPNTVVLAVVPAFERVRNSQAFQLVQQYKLMDSTIGVLTMVDRALDETNPDGPLAEVMSRLDGTSGDVVDLKHGYVAVKNRDTRSALKTLVEAKAEEDAWLEENLPGYIDRGLASSTVLATKLEKMLAEHVRVMWVPDVLTKIKAQREKTQEKLAGLGRDPQDIVNDFLGVSLTIARKRMLELIKPIIPELLGTIDEKMQRLAALVHEDFLQSREEHELILAPFLAKKKQVTSAGSLMAASMVMLDSHATYITEHLVQIMKNVVLRIVHLIQKTVATLTESKPKGSMPQRVDRFANLHYFFAGVLWERLNELLIDEEELLHCLDKSFLEFDPEKAGILLIPARIETTSPRTGDQLKNLARDLELYLESKGFQNTSLDEVFLPTVSSAENTSLTRDMSRLIISAQVPTLTKSNSQGFGKSDPHGSFKFGVGFTTTGIVFPAAAQQVPKKKSQEVGEFESRLFFAVTSHVVAPLLQSICDVNDLARNMQEYVSRYPKVNASKMHIFRESTSDRRKQLVNRMKRLDSAAAVLKSTSVPS